MRADRRVDAARPREAAGARHHLLVQRLAHAVQALELVLALAKLKASGVIDRRHRVRIVRGELRIDGVRRGQQPARARQVRQVGVRLARIDREVLEAVDLRALDLGIPVGALDETDHQPVATAPREIDDEVDDVRRALQVGLHDEAETVPAGEPRLGTQTFQQVERDLEPVRLFGVDVDADVVAAREQREVA